MQELQQQLSSLDLEEKQILIQLNECLHPQEWFTDKLKSIETLGPRFKDLKLETLSLFNNVSRTWKMAQLISEKIKFLDTEQSRIQETIQLIDLILFIQSCALETKKSIESNDIETAAFHVSQYLAQNQQLLESIFEQVPSGQTLPSYLLSDGSCPILVLKTAQKALTGLITDGFDSALKRNDKELMTKFLKLFPIIGQADLGLERMGSYLSSFISRQCHDVMKKATEASDVKAHRIYVDLLAQIYEMVAVIIDQQSQLILSIFGEDKVYCIIRDLDIETRKQSCLILNSFADQCQLEKRVHEIKKSDHQQPSGQVDTELDLKLLDSILGDIALISQKTFLFDRFIEKRMQDYNAVNSHHQRNETFEKYLKELTTFFITMQDFYMKQSIQKALSIDQWETGNATSSCVDDVFFILKASARRAISTMDQSIFVSTLSSMAMCLDQDFLNFLTLKLHSASGTLEHKQGRLTFIILVNNLDVSCDYIVKLVKDLESELAMNPLAIVKVKSSLSSLNEEASSLRTILKSWMDTLFNHLKGRIKPLFMQAMAGDVKYVLNDQEYAELQSNPIFYHRFTTVFSKFIAFYKKYLTLYNYNLLLQCIIEQLFKEWEHHLMTLKFNLLGATRLDQDIRAVTAYLASISDWSFREKFARLNQCCILLNLDSVQEVYEYWGNRTGPMAWKLSAQEVKKVLQSRIDLPVDQILSLKL